MSNFLESRLRNGFINEKAQKLLRIYNNPVSTFGKVLGFKINRANAGLALHLIYEHPDQKDSYNKFGYFIPQVQQDDARFRALYNAGGNLDFLNDSRQEILKYFFKEDMIPGINSGYKMIRTLMYQDSYYRRSFRSNGLEQIYFCRQINFLIQLLQEEQYDLSLKEKIIYANNTNASALAFVIAGSINNGDAKIRKLCMDAILGNHPKAKPSRALIKGMLLSNDADCWEAVAKLLLSAQRQEGLRQVILECLDETSLGAMKYMIKLILEHKLSRFSSVVRAIDVWAGFGWEAAREKTVNRFLELADLYLNQPELIPHAIESKDNAEVYMALWSQGVLEVLNCMPLIDKLIQKDSEKRSVALYFVKQVGLSNFSIKYAQSCLESEDPLTIQFACELLNEPNFIKLLKRNQALQFFERLEALQARMPIKKKKFPSRVFDWLEFSVDRSSLHSLMLNLLDLDKKEDLKRILPYYNDLSVDIRSQLAAKVLKGFGAYEKKPLLSTGLKDWQIDFAFDAVSDRSSDIRQRAMSALKEAQLSESRIEELEPLLKRKSAEFRRSMLELIQQSGVPAMRSSAQRLLEAGSEEQRLAGLDLLLKLQEAGKKDFVEEHLQKLLENHQPSAREALVLEGFEFVNEDKEDYSAKNGFKIYEPRKVHSEGPRLNKNQSGVLKKYSKTSMPGLSMEADKVDEALMELGNLFKAHQKEEISYKDHNGQLVSELLGQSIQPFQGGNPNDTAEEAFAKIPLHEVWEKWYLESGLQPNDLLLININSFGSFEVHKQNFKAADFKAMARKIYVPKIPEMGGLQWQNPLPWIIRALEKKYALAEAIDFLSDYLKLLYGSINLAEAGQYTVDSNRYYTNYHTWRDAKMVSGPLNVLRNHRYKMSASQFETYWNLVTWSYLSASEEHDLQQRYLPELDDYLKAFELKLINEDSLYWRIMMPDAIKRLSSKPFKNQLDLKEKYPFVVAMLDKVRDRILEVELIRGETSTPLTHLAQNLNHIYGSANFIAILNGLGKETLNRGYIYSWGNHEYTKKQVLSALLKSCHPDPEEEQTAFNEKISASKISEKRLVEAAVYAPQWLKLISNYLGWKDMESGVWWLHAHAKNEYENSNEGEIAKYSSVEMADFNIGAVDIDWFQRTYKSLGKANWEKLYRAAKYISSGNGHSRAKLYADVITGNTKITAVLNKIKETRNQDYLRVYGVIPLNKNNPEADTLRRYKFLQDFKKESKQHGSQRQASEAIAVKVAFENLARTAGYPDPLRLEWAMESKETREVLERASEILIDDLRIALEIDEHGKASVNAYRDGKKLKTIPAKERKNKEVLKLKEMVKGLREQYRRTRKSLEEAMVRGDRFSAEELENLVQHPVLKPMLDKLLFISDQEPGFWRAASLQDQEGNTISLNGDLRIAHCFDLHQSGKWSVYQKYCFDNQLVQPFKQIFRELYIPTDDELKEVNFSRRYAGHQIQPRKAVALLKTRAWTIEEYSGLQKVMHQERLVATMLAEADWFTAAEVEAPKIEGLEFRSLRKGERIDLKDIEGRIFSEIMRDLDLVVSVAHVGEVDPEASQSSIELRASIVKETARLFKLKNVEVKGNHVLIKGDLAEYSVHLGSTNCHVVAGPEMSIIAVPSQHRGRMFLPFIDDDPKTAELLAKVLLLARDKKIKDPTILKHIQV